MRTHQFLRMLSALGITAAMLHIGTGPCYFIAGFSFATFVFSSLGFYVVRQQERRFSKWLRDAVETEIVPEEAPEPAAP